MAIPNSEGIHNQKVKTHYSNDGSVDTSFYIKHSSRGGGDYKEIVFYRAYRYTRGIRVKL